MGASLEVDSAPGEGSRFSFDLTLPISTAERKLDHRQSDRTTFSFDGGKQVLIAEDNEINQLVVVLSVPFACLMSDWMSDSP